MLVLGRTQMVRDAMGNPDPGCYVDVDGPCRVLLVEAHEGKGRIGIEADASVPIKRGDAQTWMPLTPATVTVASGATWTVNSTLGGRITIRNESGDVRFDGSRESAVLHLAMALAREESR